MLEFWFATDQGPRWVQIKDQEAVFFVARDYLEIACDLLADTEGWRQTPLELRTFNNEPVNAFYFLSQKTARASAEALELCEVPFWEADIRPADRYLMERFITSACDIHVNPRQHRDAAKPIVNPKLIPSTQRPDLKMVSIDIETSMDAKELYSIAVSDQSLKRVFMLADEMPDGEEPDDLEVIYCRNARACLMQFLLWLEDYDPDILIGWNVVGFDLWVLSELCRAHKLAFTLGRAAQVPHWREEENGRRRFITIPGRVALDGIEVLKAAMYRFDSFSLESVAQQLLGAGKLLSGSHRGEDISTLFQTDKLALARYNLRDCELVWDIFKQEKLLEFAVERSYLTGLLLDRIGGSVAAFEFAYLPRLHRHGYVAPNLGELESDIVSPGGYVMESLPGIYNNVLVLDFKSLYPSIIRSFLIDPLGFWRAEHEALAGDDIVPGFNGAFFSKHSHILPSVIEGLWRARDEAKRQGNEPLSQAIKILMNSFYGVLGSTGCRFYDPRVCSSITLRGHEIIQTSRERIEDLGYKVIYGDTDSVFVWLSGDVNQQLAAEIGESLALDLNQWWQAKLEQDFNIGSALEIEFETHYLKFLMPTIRGAETGSKKRYAGMVERDGELRMVFKGLESVRTDWTPLAKQFQEVLYERIFLDEPFEDFIVQTAAEVLRGERDDELVYRKRLRRSLADYTKTAPPHVKAARKLRGQSLERGDWIEYVLTSNGPEPLAERQSRVDYHHYVDKQLAPVADSVLQFKGLSFHELIDRQLTLFSK